VRTAGDRREPQVGILLDFDNEPDVGKSSWISRTKSSGYIAAYWSTIDVMARSIASKVDELCTKTFDYEQLSDRASLWPL
jgi:hypothetical protein